MTFDGQVVLRFHILRAIRQGALPAEARQVMTNPDAWQALTDGVTQQAALDASSGTSTHPILAWIAANLPAILTLVMELLPLFGVPVPPITIPPFTPPGGTPAPAPTTPGRTTGDMPTAFALPTIPPAVLAIAEQFAAQAMSALLPAFQAQVTAIEAKLEAKLQAWIDSHTQAA